MESLLCSFAFLNFTCRKTAKKLRMQLGVRIDKLQPFVVKKLTVKCFSFNRNCEKLAASREMAKLLTVSRKSHHPIESLIFQNSSFFCLRRGQSRLMSSEGSISFISMSITLFPFYYLAVTH